MEIKTTNKTKIKYSIITIQIYYKWGYKFGLQYKLKYKRLKYKKWTDTPERPLFIIAHHSNAPSPRLDICKHFKKRGKRCEYKHTQQVTYL